MRLSSVKGWRVAVAAGAVLVFATSTGFAQGSTNNSDQSPWANPNGPLGNAQTLQGAGNGPANGFGTGPAFGGGPMMDARGPYGRVDNRYGRGNAGRAGTDRGYGRGMMGGPGFGPGMGPGAMGGPGFGPNNSGERIASDQVSIIVKGYLARFTGESFDISKIIEFQNDFYVQVMDSATHNAAFEIVVGAYGGGVRPTPVAMMWNTEYGRAQYSLAGNIGEMTVTQATATQSATDYVKKVSSNAAVGQVVKFPGYYSFIVTDGGKTVGVLSVDGYSGNVQYQNWNGAFVKSVQ